MVLHRLFLSSKQSDRYLIALDRTDALQFDLSPGISVKSGKDMYVRVESASIPIVRPNVNASNNNLVLFYGNYTSGVDLATAMNATITFQIAGLTCTYSKFANKLTFEHSQSSSITIITATSTMQLVGIHEVNDLVMLDLSGSNTINLLVCIPQSVAYGDILTYKTDSAPFLGRADGFGARALPAIQRFGNVAGNILHKRWQIALVTSPQIFATNLIKYLTLIYNKRNDMEALPDFFNYVPRLVAPPAEMVRSYLSPSSGGGPMIGGSKAEFSIPCGQASLHLDPTQTVLSYTINNGNAAAMTLDGGGHACLQSLSVFFGSVLISQTDEMGALFALTQDFTTNLDSLRSSGTVRGVADFNITTLTPTGANIKDAYYSRAGATIAPSGSLIVALPIMNVLDTLAMKAIPLSQLLDSIRLEVRLDGAVEKAMIDSLNRVVHCPTMDFMHFRTTVAANSGFISAQIPVRVSQLSNVFIILRESAVTNGFSRKLISQRTKAGMIDYRFKIGSMVVPQSAVNCTNSAAEARAELQRAFGGGVADSAAHSCISADQYLNDGFAVGLSLAAFPSSDALLNGISTQALHCLFEAKIASNNPACYLNIWVQSEKMIVCQGGLMTYEN
ncbi:hypothetical protein T492DRAFT_836562 [Pavlovales sp. CCMP2436]|nr:hypothetical protein T492DRAFT_836562 [Pavlovales sp. CCMP2436]